MAASLKLQLLSQMEFFLSKMLPFREWSTDRLLEKYSLALLFRCEICRHGLCDSQYQRLSPLVKLGEKKEKGKKRPICMLLVLRGSSSLNSQPRSSFNRHNAVPSRV